MKKKELQMPKRIFFKVLERMLEHHEVLLKMSPKHLKETKKLYKTTAKYTISHYDDFYEFLEHWKDYKEVKNDGSHNKTNS